MVYEVTPRQLDSAVATGKSRLFPIPIGVGDIRKSPG